MFPAINFRWESEANQSIISIIFRMPDLKAGLASTNLMLEKKKVEVNVFLAGVLSLRFAKLLERGSEYKVMDIDVQSDRVTRTMLYFEITFSCSPGDEITALKSVYTELERFRRFGIHETELQQLNLLTGNPFYRFLFIVYCFCSFFERNLFVLISLKLS